MSVYIYIFHLCSSTILTNFILSKMSTFPSFFPPNCNNSVLVKINKTLILIGVLVWGSGISAMKGLSSEVRTTLRLMHKSKRASRPPPPPRELESASRPQTRWQET